MRRFIRAVVIFILLTAAINFSQPIIPHSVIAVGGSSSTNTNYRIAGTVGQSGIGTINNPSYVANVGFWYVIRKTITSVKEMEEEIPLIYELRQNYPNPFNPSTVIKFSIVENAFTQIKLYDILGSEVAELVNEELEPGVYELNFTAKNLSSGVYIYRMTSGSFVDVKKMNLVK